MKTAALYLAVSLAVGGPSYAGERAVPAKPHCVTIDVLKADLKGAKFTPLNVAQFHFVQGVYSATPPIGPPPSADSAVLLQMKGKNLVLWMKAECASQPDPMPIPDGMAAYIRSINPVAGEAYDDTSKDLHL